MKNIFYILIQLLITIVFTTNLFAQNTTSSLSNIKMGIVLGSGLNIGNATNKSLIKNEGIGYNLSIGMSLQKIINPNLSFNTGVEFDFDNFSYRTKNQTGEEIYYFYSKSESKIITKEEFKEGYDKLKLDKREFSTIYLTIPTMLTGRTNMIGKNSYFARIGLRHSFLLKDVINDEGLNNLEQTITEEGLTSPKELSVYKLNLGLSIGTEWNFIQNSFVVFEIGYYVGLTNIHQGESLFGDDKQKDMSLILGKTTPPNYTTFKGTQNQLLLKATFLF